MSRCCAKVTKDSGGLEAFPGSPDLPGAAAADPDWCRVGLSRLLRGEPSLCHPAVCVTPQHFVYFLLVWLVCSETNSAIQNQRGEEAAEVIPI